MRAKNYQHSETSTAITISGNGVSRYSKIAMAVFVALSASSGVMAQSTGTLTAEGIDEVVITGKGTVDMAGVTNQNAAKSRVSITGASLQKSVSGQTFLDSLNQVPGLNFVNNDAYGTSGGNLRLRGFDGNRVSLTFDGIPLNDTGNYAVYTNQMIDAELIQSVDVNLGTTDVDSPTASAIGGTINNRTRVPAEQFGGMVSLAGGQSNFARGFGMVETGAFGAWNTKAYLAGSYASNDKFKGPGEMFKRQVNGRIQQDFENGNFIALAFHYNINRNNFYRNSTEALFTQFGRQYDNNASCVRDAATAGTRDDDNSTLVASTTALLATDNIANPAACTNYYGLRINPSDTGNVRMNSLWNLSENLRLTVDPSFQTVLANGGGTTVMNETPGAATVVDRRVTGSTALTGFDLNGDGDILDSVRYYSPNNTNTKRLGLNASLIWDMSETQRLRVAYAYDYGRHRQTGEFGYLDSYGNPENVFGGNQGRVVMTADGSIIRSRDRFSIAELNQFSVEWRGTWMENKLTTIVGVRAPRFTRDLNQYCYTVNASSNVLCTTQTPSATLASGNVRFGTSTTEYLPPFVATAKFQEMLPNLGLTFALSDTQTVYGSFAGGLSAPRTDNLYASRRLVDGSLARANPDPEQTNSFDIGWRLNTDTFIASAALWTSQYTNRIVSSFDDALGFSVDRNVGDVDLQGFDMQAGWQLNTWSTVSFNASYNDSELKDNLKISATTTLPTAGKKFVETPEMSYGVRVEISPIANLKIGLEGKAVDERFTTDLNDAFVSGYNLFHLDVGYDFMDLGLKNLHAQLNVYNLFDEEFFGNISSTTGAIAAPGFTPSAPFLSLGAPRSASASLQMRF